MTRRNKTRGLLAVVALSASSLGMGCAGEVGGVPPAIFNGALDPGHTSVGMLLVGSEDKGQGATASFACTATLIGRQTVLTAAHCVESAAALYSVWLDGLTYAVERFAIHPQYAGYGMGAAPYETYAHDVAVLRLLAEPSVAPTAIAAQPPFAGQPITLVGYGGRPPAVDPPLVDGVKPAPSAPSAPERHAATNRVHTVRPEYYVYELDAPEDGNICSGDSGGPTFAIVDGIEAQIGVHSQSRCRDGGGADRRLDVHAAWILQVAEGDALIVGGGGEGGAARDDPQAPADDDATKPGAEQPPPGTGTPAPDGKQPPPGDEAPDGPPPAPGAGKPGAPCAANGDCGSGKCVAGAKGAQCA